VYEAINSINGSMFALKEIANCRDVPSRDVEREVSTMQSLSHPNIVKYLGANTTPNGTLQIFMEYVTGRSLASRLKEYYSPVSPMPIIQVQHCVRQLLEGLSYLHGQNIIHRDIKAANVLCSTDGVMKLADFGTSKSTGDCQESGLKGTVVYMAPEVLMHHNYTAACDIWALGCLALEMITAENAWATTAWYKAERRGNIDFIVNFVQKANNQGVPIPVIPDGLPESARSFLQQCLTTNPEDRPTARTLLSHKFMREDFSAVSTHHVDPNAQHHVDPTADVYQDNLVPVTLASWSGSSENNNPTSPVNPAPPPPAAPPGKRQGPSSGTAKIMAAKARRFGKTLPNPPPK
jgi:serine/threonine protein kinase